jgi:hypothetical protein
MALPDPSLPPTPSPDAVPDPSAPEPPRRERPMARARLNRREATIVAAFALGTMGALGLVLRLAFGAAAARTPGAGALRPIGTPPKEQCAVRRDDGRVVGKVAALMGRGGRLAAYRVEEWPGHGVAPVASTLDVAAEGVRLVPCSTLQAPRPVR